MNENQHELAVAGTGAHRIRIRLDPIPRPLSARPSSFPMEAFDAVALTGADFDGHHVEGLSRLQARAYAPSDFEDTDRARCLLASFKFNHVVLDHSSGGLLDFSGVLVSALAYPQDVYDRIAAPMPLLEIPEIFDHPGGVIRHSPVPHRELSLRLGWLARITIAPMNEASQTECRQASKPQKEAP